MLRLDFAQIGEEFPEEINIIVDFPPHHPVDKSNMDVSWMGLYSEVEFPEIGDNPVITHHWIHINPTSTGLYALDTLTHELVHATTNDGHGDRFREVAAAIGLDDRGTASSAEEALMQRLIKIRNILGPYPLVTDCLEEA